MHLPSADVGQQWVIPQLLGVSKCFISRVYAIADINVLTFEIRTACMECMLHRFWRLDNICDIEAVSFLFE